MAAIPAMKITLEGRPDDSGVPTQVEHIVYPRLADVAKAERLGGTDAGDFHLTKGMRIAYFAAKRQGIAGNDYEAWEETVLELEEAQEAPKAKASKR